LFNSAVDWELIGKSPFATVKRPKLVTRPWHYLQPDEYRRLLQVAPLRWKALYSIAYGCALRRGELISFLWTDVNLKIAEVRVQNHPATATLPGFFIKDNECRTIPLPKHTCNILTDLKTYNSATDKTPYVLLNEQQYNTVLAKWKRFKQQNRPWRNRDMQNNTLKTFERHLKWAGIKAMGTLSIHTL